MEALPPPWAPPAPQHRAHGQRRCPKCGQATLISYQLRDSTGGVMDYRYACTFYRNRDIVIGPCGWSGVLE